MSTIAMSPSPAVAPARRSPLWKSLFVQVLAALLLFKVRRGFALLSGALFGLTFGGLTFDWLRASNRLGDWFWNAGTLAMAGIIWAYLGTRTTLPPMPDIPANQLPGPLGSVPWKATGASSGTKEATEAKWAGEMSGPISVDSRVGSPTTTPLTAGSSNSMKRS